MDAQITARFVSIPSTVIAHFKYPNEIWNYSAQDGNTMKAPKSNAADATAKCTKRISIREGSWRCTFFCLVRSWRRVLTVVDKFVVICRSRRSSGGVVTCFESSKLAIRGMWHSCCCCDGNLCVYSRMAEVVLLYE